MEVFEQSKAFPYLFMFVLAARGGGGGVLGPKNDGGVPLAAENWTQKDWGKN